MITQRVQQQATGRRAPTADELRQFDKDFETICAARCTAMEYLQHEELHLSSAEGMKRTRMAYLDVGRALVRIHAAETHLERYGTWLEFCNAVKIKPSTAYLVMRTVRTLDNIPEEVQEAIGPLSGRQLSVFSQADEEQQAEVLQEAVETGDTATAFAGLREQLDAEKEESVEEAEMPPQPAAPPATSKAAWGKTWLENGRKFFRAWGLAEARAHLDALDEILNRMG